MANESPLSRVAGGRPGSPGRPLRRLCALAAAIVISGIGSYLLIGNPGVQAAPGSPRFDVSFDEWTISRSQATVDQGKTTVVVSNNGVVDHELLILKTATAPGELPQGISGPVPELVGELVLGKPHQHVSTNDSYAVLGRPRDENTKSHIAPGDEVAYEVDLEPGKYVLYCNLPGHYQRGQFISLTVRKDATDA